MYTVKIDKECSCFKKSQYNAEETFKYQPDAYNYANTVIELMNEDFCKTHMFYGEKSNDNEYLIRVMENTNSDDGSCSTGSCGSCGC